MNKIYAVMPGRVSKELMSMVEAAALDVEISYITDAKKIPDLKDKVILFAAELNAAGTNIPMLEIISTLYERGTDALSGSSGAVLIKSPTELYTKSASQNIIFLANNLGCRFMGHPVVEAIEGLKNLRTWQKQLDIPLEDICLELCRKLGRRLQEDIMGEKASGSILALHSSFRKTSNTLELWHMVSKHLPCSSITELHVENGEVLDCKGCAYKTCMYYSSQDRCFYGGVMQKDILPAMEKSGTVVWICPNYNDAVSANLTAVINRLTALYRKTGFYNKTIYSVIVSGNSGSDSVAKQLVGALNINKGFNLPPYFSIMEIANETGEIKKVPGIEKRAYEFAQNIIEELKIGSVK